MEIRLCIGWEFHGQEVLYQELLRYFGLYKSFVRDRRGLRGGFDVKRSGDDLM